MSGARLERLGARLLGRAPALSPRIASRFETSLETPLAAAPADPSPPAARFSDAPPRTAPEALTRAQPAHTPAAAVHAAPSSAERPAAALPTRETRIVQPGEPAPRSPEPRREAERQSSPTPVAPSPPQILEIHEAATPDTAPSPEPPPQPNRDKPVTRRDLASELSRLRAWMDKPAEPPPSPPVRPVPASTPQPRVAAQPPPSVARDARPLAPPAPPPVEISIGTIIVRATTPPAPAPAPTVNRAAGLAQFLARRSAGLP